ncbi:dihydrolipoamide dehydrogenase [Natronincola peptidivorans]|uniref:Dihydrolipoyl dehydrogenase n=1 Tax=Natronincola peptidivorans TaxID=426128 RepID=A0A1I0BLB1_9FIRM|nr:dihydrolipoyl dehydrogenase [Natronincola peptidivorans]SET07792.1 dihydrolipoamide dehydrogenase [Natronincola peptidivorans]
MRIAVLGGGPGGYVAAIRAAQLGAEVTIIEKEALGGTCLNVGCIPTKVLLHTAELYSHMKEVNDIGLVVEKVGLDWDKLQERKNNVVKQLVDGVKALLNSNKVKIMHGRGHFISKNQLEVQLTDEGKEIIDFDYAIVAVGSESTKIPIEGATLENVINSDEALSLEEIPKSICIIGGGVIGTEFASIYSRLGSKVTVVEMLPNILNTMDQEIVQYVEHELEKNKVEIKTNTKVKAIKEDKGLLEVSISYDNTETKIQAEKVLIATGRKPSTDHVGLKEIGIKLNGKAIDINKKMQTNINNIYAIGDCTGGIMLAHVASAQGIVAAETIMGEEATIDFKTIPSCVYTKPEIATVGLTEEEAKTAGYNVKTGKFPFMANGKSLIMQETEGMVKFVADAKTGEVLGLHIAGPRATDMIAEGSLAIRLEATIDEIITTIHGHPTVSEAVLEAAHDVYDSCIHVVKR